jgi:LPS export ABC transporter permease LptF
MQKIWLKVMKIITKYTIREQIAPFFIGLTFFTFIFILQKIFRIASLLIVKKVPFFIVIKLFLFAIPFTMAITVPMAMLVAVIMSLGRFSSDSEITAITASGIPLMKIFRTYIITGFFISIALMLFNDTVLVYSNIHFKKIYKEIIKLKPSIALEEKSFTEFGNGISIWITKKNDDKGLLFDVLLIQRDKDGSYIRIYSHLGKLLLYANKYQTLILHNAEFGKSTKNGKNYHNVKIYKHLTINIPLFSLEKVNIKKGPREMTFLELLKNVLIMIVSTYYKNYTKKIGGIDKLKNNSILSLLSVVSLKNLLFSSYSEDINYRMVELFKKYLIPLACFSFSLIGAPLGIFSKRTGKTASLGMAIGIIFIFYPFLVLGQTFGYSGKLPPFVAIALPNLIIILIGLFLLYKKK